LSFFSAGKDYQAETSELKFDSTTRRVCSEIVIVDDGVKEQNESFLVVLVATQTHPVLLKPQSAVVTILDSDCKLTTCCNLCNHGNTVITSTSFCRLDWL